VTRCDQRFVVLAATGVLRADLVFRGGVFAELPRADLRAAVFRESDFFRRSVMINSLRMQRKTIMVPFRFRCRNAGTRGSRAR
jgi:hypothetical protein